MDVRNCKNCGKLFQFVGKPICPACNKKLEDKFFEVRDYIYENPTANMGKVSEEMDVPIQQIKKWVREAMDETFESMNRRSPKLRTT